LPPKESLALAFEVLAGLGSIVHLHCPHLIRHVICLAVLLLAVPAVAQSLPDDPALLEPLPDIALPDIALPDMPLPDDLPDMDFGEPIALPPVSPPDPNLMVPLPPLTGFDAAPRTDFIFTEAAQEGVRYSVTVTGLEQTGLSASFRRLSALQRGANKPATAAQIASRVSADKALMQRLLFSEGWYGGTTEALVDVTADSRASISMIAVPGDRYRWREITLDLIPSDKPELGAGFRLSEGDPIRAIAVEEAEGALLLHLLQSGYPFAEIGARDVVLDTETPTGTYLLTGDTGPAGIFGDIRMSGFQPFDEKHAAVIARFEPGEAYNVDLLDDFRRALIDTQQFGGVTVSVVDTGLREPDGRAIAEVRVVGNRGPQRLLTGQLGYATDEGFRAEALWRHRSLITPEGNFIVRAVLGSEEQRFSTGLVMGNFGQRDRTLDFTFDISGLDRPGYQSNTISLSANLRRLSTHIWQKRWTWGAGFQILASDERERSALDPRSDDFDARQTFFIAALPLHLGYDRSNDLLDPVSGYRLAISLTPEISKQEDIVDTYARTIIDGSAYRQFSTSFVLAGRLRLGSIIGADRDNIAPTRRFYAGGGGSVRGFDYEGIGEVGFNGRPIGGRGLFESSLEGRYRFGNFGAVAFIDAGSVNEGSLPSASNMRFGIGVGGRYYSSFGPIRIDVARAINREARDPQFALYISIGQAF